MGAQQVRIIAQIARTTFTATISVETMDGAYKIFHMMIIFSMKLSRAAQQTHAARKTGLAVFVITVILILVMLSKMDSSVTSVTMWNARFVPDFLVATNATQPHLKNQITNVPVLKVSIALPTTFLRSAFLVMEIVRHVTSELLVTTQTVLLVKLAS